MLMLATASRERNARLRSARSSPRMRSRLPSRVGLALLSGALVLAIWVEARASVSHALPPCPGGATLVVVDTDARVLVACEDGRAALAYRVRLGSGGVGKTREGDRRTPLGRYPLEAPRPSELTGTFVHVGYPTEAQRAAGYTGSAIGIHGPLRDQRYLGAYTNVFDTTAGCVGLATDEEIEELAGWISSRGVDEVEIF
jgi:hypothetical protein